MKKKNNLDLFLSAVQLIVPFIFTAPSREDKEYFYNTISIFRHH